MARFDVPRAVSSASTVNKWSYFVDPMFASNTAAAEVNWAESAHSNNKSVGSRRISSGRRDSVQYLRSVAAESTLAARIAGVMHAASETAVIPADFEG